MANGLGSFYVGAAGLQSAQNALNTTANNFANVDTKGYVRQGVRFADGKYTTIGTSTQSVNIKQTGLGVSIGDVSHARDIFLDKAYRRENGRQGFYENCYEVASYVQDLFQELDGEEFKGSLSDLWESVQEIAKEPDNSTKQSLLIQKSELFLSRSSSLYSDLKSYQANINLQIKEQVNRVNEIGQEIYKLNVDIQKVEAGGIETAMTLRDARDLLIDELSNMVKISAEEDPTGAVFVEIEGVTFVDDNKCYEMGLERDKVTEFYTPYWPHLAKDSKNAQVFDIHAELSTEFNTDIGGIKALLVMRGDGYGKYTDLDTDNYKNVQDCLVMETEAEIDYLVHSITTQMNDALCPNIEMSQDNYNILTTGSSNGVTLDSYYQIDLNGSDLDKNPCVTLRNINTGEETYITPGCKILDVENCNVGADGQLPPEEMFVRDGCDRYTPIYGTENGNKKVIAYVYNEEYLSDGSTCYKLGSISVNDRLQNEVTALPVFTQNGGVDYTLGDSLKECWTNETMKISPTDPVPSNYEGYYDKIIGRIGTAGGVYNTSNETLLNTVASVDNQRQQIQGVSSDEELTSMIKYQAAYNAASRYITVISEMTELIVTGLV